MRQLFLDAQAGLLARTLEKGETLPLSADLMEHPSPCGWEERYGDISEEKLDECGRRKEELQKKQEELGRGSEGGLSLAQAKEEDCREKWSRLLEKDAGNDSRTAGQRGPGADRSRAVPVGAFR